MSLQKKIVKEELGQIFTPPNIASLMAYLLLNEHNLEEKTILDPCIGRNIFFNTIKESFKNNSLKFSGIEIDEGIINKDFFKINTDIQIMDFFDLPLTYKYDYIIMNPPYVRHEILSNSSLNNKTKLEKIIGKDIKTFKGRANLYIYFFFKALQHLKKNGKLVAITYDSWLYTEYGNLFKKYLGSHYYLKTLIHFRKSVFENVNIGATILEIINNNNDNKTKRIEIDRAEDIPQIITSGDYNTFIHKIPEINEIKSSINYESSFFETIAQKYPNVRRGIETLGNRFFYLQGKQNLPFTYSVIKNIKSIKKFSVDDSELSKLLIIPKEESKYIQGDLIGYLDNIKQNIERSSKSYLSLRRRLHNDDNWFVVKTVLPGKIIFNYYFRDRVDFIFNPKLVLTANNFYIIDSKNPLLDLALLNSSFTKISILDEARDQGRGLKKLQMYEFKDVKVVDKNKLSKTQKKKLLSLGEKLARCRRGSESEIIKKIDEIIANAYNEHINMKRNSEDIIQAR